MLPVRQLNIPISNVAVPAFSRLVGDPERFARYYLRAASLIMWIGAPVFGVLFVAAEPVIILTLGSRWRGAAPVFQVLAISALGQLLLQSATWLLVSRGQSKRLLKLWLIISPIFVGSFVVGLPFGSKGVALSYSLVLLSILPLILKFAFRGTNLTLQRLGQTLLCPVSLCLAGVLIGKLALQLIAPARPLLQVLVVALGVAGAYSFSLLIPRARKEIVSFRELLGELGFSKQVA
jgi:PST family polysaccharide transporter